MSRDKIRLKVKFFLNYLWARTDPVDGLFFFYVVYNTAKDPFWKEALYDITLHSMGYILLDSYKGFEDTHENS